MIGFVVFSTLYGVFFCWARFHWQKIRTASSSATIGERTFSVILPVRNEVGNIESLIEDLELQNYPKDRFEVLLIDDHSEDDTVLLAQQAFQKTKLDFRIVHLGASATGKKQAITVGLEMAKYEHILTTDGDCRVGKAWISAFSDSFETTGHLMLCGPVKMEAQGIFTKIQALEFSGLTGVGAASLQAGNPSMCNGANLAYKKKTFEEVKGYEGNAQIPSGDDEFLLQKIFANHQGRVSYLKDQRAIVSTNAKGSLKELFNQRIRWSSKWRFHDSNFIKLMAIGVFLNYSFFLFALVMSAMGLMNPWVFVGVFLGRWLCVLLFSYPITQFLGVRGVVFGAVVFEIIYPFFVVILGIASIFGKYSWKGRFYR